MPILIKKAIDEQTDKKKLLDKQVRYFLDPLYVRSNSSNQELQGLNHIAGFFIL
jgi:hypothetical protein